MRKSAIKYIALLLVVSLAICGCASDDNADTTYKSISINSVTLEIPSDYAHGNDSNLYKEYFSEKNKDMVWLDYTEDNDYYEEAKKDAWDSLSNIDDSATNFTNIQQSQLEIDGVICHKIGYVEKNYNSVLIFIPVDNGVVSVCVYIEDDIVLEHVVDSITITK